MKCSRKNTSPAKVVFMGFYRMSRQYQMALLRVCICPSMAVSKKSVFYPSNPWLKIVARVSMSQISRMSIYLWPDDKQRGPFTLESLKSSMASGRVFASQTACCKSGTEWLPLSQLLNLASSAAGIKTKSNDFLALPRRCLSSTGTQYESK
jgi:hypothetical protein